MWRRTDIARKVGCIDVRRNNERSKSIWNRPRKRAGSKCI